MSETKATNYKVVIVGKSAVGKSSLMFRFTDDRFNENYLTTIGVDFKFRSFKLKEQSYKLQIWDTAGQEKYQTITKTFYKGAHAVIVVFDLTNKKSFDDLKEQWFPEIENNCDEDVAVTQHSSTNNQKPSELAANDSMFSVPPCSSLQHFLFVQHHCLH